MNSYFSSTITITFGDQAENHVGMQKLGNGLANEGFSVEELTLLKQKIEENDDSMVCELIDLNKKGNIDVDATSACVLIVRNGVEFFAKDSFKNNDIHKELESLEWDTKAKMYGRIVNKHARHNLCFADFEQKPDYDAGKGTVVSYESVPLLRKVRTEFQEFFGSKAKSLFAEGNLYYDTSKCGIGYHGDAERKIVVAFRLGATLPLHYHWFHEGKPIGDTIKLTLNHGDLYVMSEKATGFDWKKKKEPTLRHAAGCSKFLFIKVQKSKKK